MVRFALAGPLVGAVLYLLMGVWCIAQYQGVEYMGVEDDGRVQREVDAKKERLIALQVRLLGLYAGVGAGVGALAAGAVLLVWAARRRRLPGSLQLAWRVVVGCLLIHGWLLARTMIRFPQALSAAYYDRGGFWRRVHVGLTDHVPIWTLDALAAAMVLVVLGCGLVVLRRHLPALVRRPRQLYALALALGLGLGAPVALALSRPAPPVTDNNLIIIAVDSLRSDRIGRTDDRSLTHFDAIAAEGTSYTNAWTVMPRTFPSWVSILTARYPHEHGIRHMFPTPANLARRRHTMVDVLRAAGYRTAVVSDFAGDIFSRLQLGFEDVRVPRFTLWSNMELGSFKLHHHLLPYLLQVLGAQRTFPILKLYERLADPEALTDEALDWIRRSDGRPFALVLFYSAAHFPYAAPHPHYAEFTDPTYEGPSRYNKNAWVNTSEAPGAAERRQAVDLYDGALQSIDTAVGRLVRQLRTWDLYDRTTLVVTADHGENLYEDGFGIGHGDHLRGQASLRIPLIVRPQGGVSPPRKVATQARSIDLAPTALDWMGMKPLSGATGRSLRGVVDGSEAPPVFMETGLWFMNPEAAVLEGRTIRFTDVLAAMEKSPETDELYFPVTLDDDLLVAKHRAMVDGRWKLVYVPTRQGVRWELYDMVDDPLERQNRVADRTDVLQRLKKQLMAWMLRDPQMVEQRGYVVPRTPR